MPRAKAEKWKAGNAAASRYASYLGVGKKAQPVVDRTRAQYLGSREQARPGVSISEQVKNIKQGKAEQDKLEAERARTRPQYSPPPNLLENKKYDSVARYGLKLWKVNLIAYTAAMNTARLNKIVTDTKSAQAAVPIAYVARRRADDAHGIFSYPTGHISDLYGSLSMLLGITIGNIGLIQGADRTSGNSGKV